jgi:hypothetical protein
MGSEIDLDYVEKRKFLTKLGLELRPSVIKPVASRYTDYAMPAPSIKKDYRKTGWCVMV